MNNERQHKIISSSFCISKRTSWKFLEVLTLRSLPQRTPEVNALRIFHKLAELARISSYHMFFTTMTKKKILMKSQCESNNTSVMLWFRLILAHHEAQSGKRSVTVRPRRSATAKLTSDLQFGNFSLSRSRSRRTRAFCILTDDENLHQNKIFDKM